MDEPMAGVPETASVAFASPVGAGESGKKHTPFARAPLVDKGNAANFMSPIEKVKSWFSPQQPVESPGEYYHEFSPSYSHGAPSSFTSPTGMTSGGFMSPSNMAGSIFGRGQM